MELIKFSQPKDGLFFFLSGCLDEDGGFRKLHEEWGPSPCLINSCSETGINYKVIDCPEEHPDPGCHLVTEPDECCPRRECR